MAIAVVCKRKGDTAVREPSIKEMERALGLDRIKPIAVTDSDKADVEQKRDLLKEFYEEELRALYKKLISSK